MRRVLLIASVIGTVAALSPALDAARAPAEYTIADGDVSGLIAAINGANASPGADVINLAAGGTYTLTASYDGTNGLPPILDSLTINGTGATIARSTGAGTPDFRIFLISTPGTVTLSGLTIRNGRGTGDFQGGAIRKFQGTLNITGSTISGNSAAWGGGIWNYQNGALNIQHSTIENNVSDDPSAGGAGGGLYNYEGVVTISHSVISGNIARSSGGIFAYRGSITLADSTVSGNAVAPGGNGGGMTIYEGTVNVVRSTFAGNSATTGGAIYNYGTLAASQSTFSGNTATLRGGAIYGHTGGQFTLTSSTVSGNAAHSPSAPTSGYGGGIFNWAGSSATVSNSTIADNFTNFAGGGIYNNGPFTIINTTIVDNTSVQYASGLASDSGAATTLRNTLLARNHLGRNCGAFGPPIVSQGHNLSDNGTCASFFIQPSDLNNALAGLDPAGLRDNGGPTYTVALLPDSAAIDAGDDAACAGAPVNNLDQRGVARPVGPRCDIGAFEGVLVLDDEGPVVHCDAPDGLWHGGDVSLACTASDEGSGLLNAGDATFVLSTSVPAGVETANAATGSHTVCDTAGNCTTAGPIAGNKVDKQAPAIAITAPTTVRYLLNQAVAASFNCVDGGSGVGSCPGTVADGAAIDTGTIGAHTFSVTATDAVGNATTRLVSYTVGYGQCVLYDPTKAHRAGSTIPIKLALCDAAGANVSSASVPLVATAVYLVSNNAPGPLADSGSANPDSQFRFADGSYIFNLSLKGFSVGTYALVYTAGADPTPQTVQFQVK